MRRRTPAVGRVRRDVRAGVLDASAFSMHVGLGESYFAAFVLALGGGQVAAGLVGTAPQLIGSALQLLAPAAVQAVGSLRRWVRLCTSTQALCFAPLAAIALAGGAPPWLVFVFASVYWASGFGSGPAWSTWMTTIIPGRARARVFSRRSVYGNIAQLSGLVAGGLLLQYGSATDGVLLAFAAIFAAAGGLRLVSTYYLGRQSEPRPLPADYRVVPLRELWQRVRSERDARLIVYMVTVTATAYTAAPFFTPFMLDVVRFNYLEYMVLIAAAFVARVIALPALGRVAHGFGARRLLAVGGVLIVPLPLLWVFSHSFWYLLVIQLLAGLAWAAYELAALLMTFETIREQDRTSLLTFFNFCNAVALLGGSLVGGGVLVALAGDERAYQVLYAFSTVARLATVLLLARVAGAR
ncbi:MAG: MFS transporter [Phycisphaerae bacterium]